MTIKIIQGDLLSQEVDAIINTVNCVGVMGKGIALQFKLKFPNNFKQYEKSCKTKELHTGKMLVHDLGGLVSKPRYIINFPTKDHWRGKSKLEFIEQGLDDLVRVIREYGIRSIAIPPLGCGNGGLNWSVVLPLIEQKLNQFGEQLEVRLFEPKSAPEAADMIIRTERPRMTAGRAILIKLISAYGDAGYLLSKIEVQKLGYFAYVSGIMPKLNYGKNQYGPFSYDLNKALDAMNGHYIIGVGDNDKSEAQISVIDDAINSSEEFLENEPHAFEALNRIKQLIDGFETPYGMELLATVHWVAQNDVTEITVSNVAQGIHNWDTKNPAWGERKKKLMEEAHIRVALERLQNTDWVQ
ncbi:MAG: macro domain-containing protein [Rickettsiales bacterium]